LEGSGRAYTSSAMGTTVARYDVDSDGKMTPGATVSFASFGLGAGYSTRTIAVISTTKAYLLDDTSLQAIVFDPDKMTTGNAIDLSAMKETGLKANFSYSVPIRGTPPQVVVTAYYYDPTYQMASPKTAVALINTSDDSVTIVKDTRCGTFSS